MSRILLVSVCIALLAGEATAQGSGARKLILAEVLESNPLKSDHRPERFSGEILRDRTGAHFLGVFIVDTLGRIEDGSIRFVRDAPAPYRSRVCAELSRVRFRPIRRDGQSRRAVVVRPFDFWPPKDTIFHVTGGARFDSTRAAIAARGVEKALRDVAPNPGC